MKHWNLSCNIPSHARHKDLNEHEVLWHAKSVMTYAPVQKFLECVNLSSLNGPFVVFHLLSELSAKYH